MKNLDQFEFDKEILKSESQQSINNLKIAVNTIIIKCDDETQLDSNYKNNFEKSKV